MTFHTKDKNEAMRKMRDIFVRNRRRLFIIDARSGEKFTYGKIENYSLRLASFLKTKGVGKGDRVAILLPNCSEFALIYFACMHLGAVSVPINQRLSRGEIRYILSNAQAKILLTEPYFLRNIFPLKPQERPTHVLFFYSRAPSSDTRADTRAGYSSFDFWREAKRHRKILTQSFEFSNDSDVLAIIYTSGTTKSPKGVIIRYGRIIKNGFVFNKLMGIDRRMRFYAVFSQAYLGGLYNAMLIQFLAGGSIVLDSTFDARVSLEFWRTVKKYRVNALWLVPSMLSMLLSLDRGGVKEVYARNIRLAVVGTAPLSPALKKSFESRYNVTLYENYGLSETFFIATHSPHLRINRGVGTILPGCKVTILGNKGRACDRGESGEVVVESKYMTSGYYRNPTETRKVIRNGRFYTGDIGFMDRNGYLYISDRKKDIIIRGGINISPREIEDVIMEIEKVREVAVVGIEHPLMGEEVVAFVSGASDLTEDEVLTYCRKTLARFKVPKRTFFIKELPKTSTGKIQKGKIKDLAVKMAKSL